MKLLPPEAKAAGLTPGAFQGLRQLWEHDVDARRGVRQRIAFHGAIGRRGAPLVQRGLAQNLGRTVYAGNCSRMGERPDAYVQFKLTAKGHALARKLFDVPAKPSASKSVAAPVVVKTPKVAVAAPVASGTNYLVYRPAQDVEDSMTPDFICRSREAADAVVTYITAFMDRLAKRLPAFPQQTWEDEEDHSKGVSDAYMEVQSRRDAILDKVRWPYGLTGLRSALSEDLNQKTYFDGGSLAIMELPVLSLASR